jgi:copper oxidase (laccase) domain-containing protein
MTFGSSLLSAIPGLRHAFSTREGGVSGGIYESLNGGLGSNDDPAHVAENRRRMAGQIGVAPEHFLSVHQVHSPDVVVATGPWPGDKPRADAIVTRTEGIAIGVIGPLIRQHSYEVGGEFVERFLGADADNAAFFIPSARDGHAMFDLAGFIRMRLENAGVLMIDDIGVDTYSDERFYSYRRSVHRNEPDYGRHVHAIALERE